MSRNKEKTWNNVHCRSEMPMFERAADYFIDHRTYLPGADVWGWLADDGHLLLCKRLRRYHEPAFLQRLLGDPLLSDWPWLYTDWSQIDATCQDCTVLENEGIFGKWGSAAQNIGANFKIEEEIFCTKYSEYDSMLKSPVTRGQWERRLLLPDASLLQREGGQAR